MKITMTIEKEFEVATLNVTAKVYHPEDAKVNGVIDEEGTLLPCMVGEMWSPIINVDTGVITSFN